MRSCAFRASRGPTQNPNLKPRYGLMQFKYTAINKEGKPESDVIEAGSYHEAVGLIHGQGLIPTSLTAARKNALNSMLVQMSGVSLQDKILFIQNLSVMLKAGVSVTRAVKILSGQTNNPKFKNILEGVYSDIESGKSLSASLESHAEIFGNIFVSMVRVGEISGNLDKSLEYLSVQLQREHDLISKTKGAMMYPAVVVGAIVIIGILMSIFVLPSLVSIFKGSGMQLPLATRIVIGFVDFMSQHTILALGIIIAVIAAAIFMLKTKSGKRAFDKTLLRSPVLGEVSKKINMARFSRIVSSMLKSGTSIVESLQIASESMGNAEYRDALAQAAKDVRVGKSIAASLSKYPRLFTYITTQMVQVGEESGSVDNVLDELATHYESEVDDTMKNLSSIIEPLMILVIGSVVGLLAVALIGPIYNMTAAAGG